MNVNCWERNGTRVWTALNRLTQTDGERVYFTVGEIADEALMTKVTARKYLNWMRGNSVADRMKLGNTEFWKLIPDDRDYPSVNDGAYQYIG